jgi:hypothetical protein
MVTKQTGVKNRLASRRKVFSPSCFFLRAVFSSFHLAASAVQLFSGQPGLGAFLLPCPLCLFSGNL